MLQLLTSLLLAAAGQNSIELPDTPIWDQTGGLHNENFGTDAVLLGDADGDGYQDIAVYHLGRRGATFNRAGVIEVYHGTAQGYPTTPQWTLELAIHATSIRDLAAAGDVNGDGFDDLLIGMTPSRAVVFYGSAAGFAQGAVASTTDDADWIADLHPTLSWIGFGESVDGAGDVNGDGFDDIVIGAYLHTAPGTPTQSGGALLYYGSANGLPTPAGGGAATDLEAGWTIQGDTHHGKLGEHVQGLGDLNGDGYGDFGVYATATPNDPANVGHLYIYDGTIFGPGIGLTDTWDDISYDPVVGLRLRHEFAVADFNADGRSDIVHGHPDQNNHVVYEPVLMRYGGTNGMEPPATIFWGNWWYQGLGESICAGDFNADGMPDLAILTDYWSDQGQTTPVGRVQLLENQGPLIGQHPFHATPSWSWSSNQANAMDGSVVRNLGDPTGDSTFTLGIGLMRHDDTTTDEGRLVMFEGAPIPGLKYPQEEPDWEYLGDLGDRLGAHAATGDYNGDGFDDLAIVNERHRPYTLELFLGEPAGLPAAPSSTMPLTYPGHSHWIDLEGEGDVNGDGMDDLLVLYLPDLPELHWANQGIWRPGGAQVFHGTPSGLSSTPSWTATQTIQEPTAFANSGRIIDDINGDGFDDLAIAATGYEFLPGWPLNNWDIPGKVYVWHGSAQGLNNGTDGTELNAAWTAEDTSFTGSKFGQCIRTAGDLNGDGFLDLLISAPRHNEPTIEAAGAIYPFLGSAQGLHNGQPADVATMTPVAVGQDRYASVGRSFTTGVFSHTASQTGALDLLYLDYAPLHDSEIHLRRHFRTTPPYYPGSSLTFFAPEAMVKEAIPDLTAVKGSSWDQLLVPTFRSDGLVAEGAMMLYDTHMALGPVLYPSAVQYHGRQHVQWASHGYSGDFNGDGIGDVVSGTPEWWEVVRGEQRGRLTMHLGTALPRMKLSIDTVRPGDAFQVFANLTSSNWFDRNAELKATEFNGNPLPNGHVALPVQGVFDFDTGTRTWDITLPSNVRPGVYTLQAFSIDFLPNTLTQEVHLTVLP